MNDDVRLATVKQYLRRKYADDIPGLKALSDQLFEIATEDVVITSQGFEGGSASGQMTYRKEAVFTAVEALILELDPTNTPSGLDGGHHLDFSQRCIEP